MDIDVNDLIPYLQSQLGALMIENASLRVQLSKLQAAQQVLPEGQSDPE